MDYNFNNKNLNYNNNFRCKCCKNLKEGQKKNHQEYQKINKAQINAFP